MEIKSSLDIAKLLNRYFDERALSSLPQNPTVFEFGQVQFADDLVTMVNGKPVIPKDIPGNLAALKNVFLTVDAVYTYLNGTIYVKATIPAGKIKEGEQHRFCSAGILDGKKGLIAVGVSQPVWMYSGRSLVVEFEINTNIA
ncbi:hypothetical protein L4174_023775 (plasmid) [Photobacterium sp. CCB-ST2H9]|uniref:hypothetical protein n=1 Tax=Photobacterium sp. CCB-ST2H9 TaxID=2912855 RepID=UPI002006809F|nr:hypothetical protein [Photobacterium sp. CCB-ST2H9]UTM60488.1 hypothetical protein L4174_023775 [Photobacterium sp. CCB-ST2H9]